MHLRNLLRVRPITSIQRYFSDVRAGFVGMVGNTPLVKLHNVSNETGCEILAKVEFANGGGSVKDRAALFLVRDAERKGQLKPGGTVVEGTAGNTGIGLAHVCNALGYKCVIFMPDTQSKEKIDLLRTLGADVRPKPVAPFDDPNNYNHIAARYAESLDNAVWTNQFDNTANKQAHVETTGPEIWRQTDGKVDAIIFGTGTGGTMAGVATYLKEQNHRIHTALADPQVSRVLDRLTDRQPQEVDLQPMLCHWIAVNPGKPYERTTYKGSVLYNWLKHGKMERTEGGSICEGIGQGRVTENLKGAPIDDAHVVWDTEAVNMTFRLLHEEGFFVGASTGLNVAGAVKVAKQLGPGHTIVTCLCDTGSRYYAKLFSREFLKSKGLLDCIPEQYMVSLH